MLKKPIVSGLIWICMFLAYPFSGSAKNQEQIFQWVGAELGIAEAIPLPKIIYLEKAELQFVFQESNRKSRQKWEENYGEHKANQLMQMYLQELVGLFDPISKTVYVGAFIDSCAKEAVLAHEIVHYYQVALNIPYPISYTSHGDQHFYREMEAYGLEKRYRRLFCRISETDH